MLGQLVRAQEPTAHAAAPGPAECHKPALDEIDLAERTGQEMHRGELLGSRLELGVILRSTAGTDQRKIEPMDKGSLSMRAPLPPLAAIRAFEAAARLGSFTRAAEELAMSQAAVSYQVKLLEARLATPLFVRLPRQVVLTEAGQRLASAATDAFDGLRGAIADIRAAGGTVLTINALAAFASNWLAPRLGRFQLAQPGLAVRLLAENRLVDLGREEVDVAIRSGFGPWPGLEQHRLMPVRFMPMVSPELLRQAGPLHHPRDLLALPRLTPSDEWWREWFQLAGVALAPADEQGGLELETQQMEGMAALAGQGVAMLSPFLWRGEIAAGRLVAPFDLLADSGRFYWLVHLGARRQVAKIREFRDWLLAEVAAEGASG